MKRVNKKDANGEIHLYFDGDVSVSALCKVEDGSIIVLKAMNGYGNPIKIDD